MKQVMIIKNEQELIHLYRFGQYSDIFDIVNNREVFEKNIIVHLDKLDNSTKEEIISIFIAAAIYNNNEYINKYLYLCTNINRILSSIATLNINDNHIIDNEVMNRIKSLIESYIDNLDSREIINSIYYIIDISTYNNIDREIVESILDIYINNKNYNRSEMKRHLYHQLERNELSYLCDKRFILPMILNNMIQIESLEKLIKQDYKYIKKLSYDILNELDSDNISDKNRFKLLKIMKQLNIIEYIKKQNELKKIGDKYRHI